MREDMAKVIVERPRHGGGVKYPRHRFRDLTDLELHPRREGVRFPWGSNRKGLNEFLNPLKRFLQTSIGRPWSKVYSEICERINANSAVQLHILQHLDDYVCRNAQVVLVGKQKQFQQLDQLGRAFGSSRKPFVVDPRDGRLKRDPRHGEWLRAYRNRPPKPSPIVRQGDRTFKLIDGVWFEIGLARITEAVLRSGCRDVVGRKVVASMSKTERETLYDDGGVFASWKQQVGKREIKRLALVSTIPV